MADTQSVSRYEAWEMAEQLRAEMKQEQQELQIVLKFLEDNLKAQQRREVERQRIYYVLFGLFAGLLFGSMVMWGY